MAHSTEMVGDLMRRLRQVSGPPARAYRLLSYLVAERRRLTASYRYIAHSPDHVSNVLRTAATAEPAKIAEADGRSGMLKELTAVFLDAAERNKREDDWGDVYAADAEDHEESYAEASALEAGSRWHEAI